ncbi:MAG: hypothetical protein V3V08_00245 [Nannocystaceae bacterium]
MPVGIRAQLVAALEAAGRALAAAPARFMLGSTRPVGLRKTLRALKDPKQVDACVLELRRLCEIIEASLLSRHHVRAIRSGGNPACHRVAPPSYSCVGPS